MLFLGVLLVALGVGALLEMPVWPVALIGIGTAFILSVGFGRSSSSAWILPACCFPLFWTRQGMEQYRSKRGIRKDSI